MEFDNDGEDAKYMEREQRIVIELGEASGNPDAEDAMRYALALFELLESVDKNSWQVGHARYTWEIVDATKNSPFMIEAVAKVRSSDYRQADVVGTLLNELQDLEQNDKPRTDSALRVPDLKRIAHLGEITKKRTMPVRIMVPNGIGKFIQFTINQQVRRHAQMRILHLEEKAEKAKPEYAVVEGLLRAVEADPRERRKKYLLSLIERGTEDSIRCQFNPSDSEELGAHVGNRVFVEGYMSVDAEGKKHLEVSAFRLIPKKPLTADELKDYGIRTPSGMDAASYIEGLRADHD